MSLQRFCLLTLVVLSLSAPAFAKSSETPKALGAFGNWRAFTFAERDQQVCYMALAINPPANKKLKRGSVRLTITHRPGEGSKDVVSYSPGYSFKPDSTVTVRLGTKSFDLFTTKDTAWARDPATDRALAAAIHSSKGLTLTGTPSQRGVAAITDTLELKGSTEAYRAIGKACGLEVEAAKPSKTKKPTQKPVAKNNIHNKGKL